MTSTAPTAYTVALLVHIPLMLLETFALLWKTPLHHAVVRSDSSVGETSLSSVRTVE
jgi:hypothetical protein